MYASRFLFAPLSLLAPLAQAESSTAPGLSGGSYFQAILALGFIVALLGALAWFARKVSGGKPFGKGGLAIVGGVALGPKERIVLIEVGEEWLVVGLVPGQIRTLHRLPKGELVPDVGHSIPPASFAQWLQQFKDKSGDTRGS